MPWIEVCFTLSGSHIPWDHGFFLYSALSSLLPSLHENPAVAILPIAGRLDGQRKLALGPRSTMVIRVPQERLPELLPLAGKILSLQDHLLQIGIPNTRGLRPSPRLYSRLVIIKGFTEPEPFLEAARRQLDDLGIKGTPSLVVQPRVEEANRGRTSGSHSLYLRRTCAIHGRQVVGFALRVGELTADESICLQEKGLGGRRHFGCGIFIPCK